MRGWHLLWLLPLLAAQPPDVRLLRVMGGFQNPVDIQHAGDGSSRLFVVEQRGRIRILRNGARLDPPFLDIANRVQFASERGLLGLAFPPGFASKQHFYLYYTDRTGDLVLARYRVSADPDRADPASETILLTIGHRQFANHNGGQLAFGPKDGYLYLAPGDGGGGGDSLRSGQNTSTLLGKILRIDVESGAVPYGIPRDNPFAGQGGSRPEIWAYGLRNPWRFSFDRETGDLYIGDVGQDRWEELDFQPAASRGGENYGWNTLEAGECFQQSGCSTAGLAMPVVQYRNPSVGCSVISGRVYRGARFPAMRGYFFYGDYCSGRIWALSNDGAAWQNTELANLNLKMSAFGEDEAGNIYLADHARGEIQMLVSGRPTLTAASVVNAASLAPGLSPGSIATIFGVGLATAAGIVEAPGLPLPRDLSGTTVTLNGIRAPLFAVVNIPGLEQINLQVPYELGGAPAASLIVSNNEWQSAAVDVPVATAQPGIFLLAEGHAAAVDVSGQVVSSANPADRGSIVNVFATGLGPVESPPASGEAASLTRLSPTLSPAQVTVGAVIAEVLFSGLAPGLAGVYQVQFRVPPRAPGIPQAGLQDLVISIGGASSNPAKLAVR